jgi:hypothetical protein
VRKHRSGSVSHTWFFGGAPPSEQEIAAAMLFAVIAAVRDCLWWLGGKILKIIPITIKFEPKNVSDAMSGSDHH